ncbi:class F sortase [Streptomyces sp. NBC_01387]|uniref:class F sortase n=1 Tax=unclassified Streptomyces TaxID=2593676 RepID=UPI002255ABF9|nr:MULTISPECIES: class F sortase [unclassified Streptomyces]MCX4549897.1 class F sortase [Streptomyces sp. NBC_01500]WSV55349.1 class F sortase [Streptomyces sp. NBC_01014]
MAAEKTPSPHPDPSHHQPQTSSKKRAPLHRALLWPAVAVAAGGLLLFNSLGTPADDAKSLPRPAAAVSAAPPTATPTAVAPLPPSDPTRLSIPAIAVNAPFTPLDIGESGALNPPPVDNTNMVGWYRGGATPGERGAAIVAGHVDTKTGPAVFLLLRDLKPGSYVNVTRQDGTVASFKVDSVETFSKADFPNDRVYGDTPDAQLRVITCGGAYDRGAQDYEDNVVVFAHLDSVKQK